MLTRLMVDESLATATKPTTFKAILATLRGMRGPPPPARVGICSGQWPGNHRLEAPSCFQVKCRGALA